jgi:hypothetical protein
VAVRRDQVDRPRLDLGVRVTAEAEVIRVLSGVGRARVVPAEAGG